MSFGIPATHQAGIRWFPAYTHYEEIPPFAPVAVETLYLGGAGASVKYREHQAYIWVVKPNADSEVNQNPSIHFINGPSPIKVHGYGRVSQHFPLQVRCDTSEFDGSEFTVGFKTDSWDLVRDGNAYRLLGFDESGPAEGQPNSRVWVVPNLSGLSGSSQLYIPNPFAGQTHTSGKVDLGAAEVNRGSHTVGTNDVTINVGGLYDVRFECTSKTDTEGDTTEYAVYKNGTVTSIRGSRTALDLQASYIAIITTQNAERFCMSGMLNLDKDDVLDVQVATSLGGTVTTSAAMLYLNLIAPKTT